MVLWVTTGATTLVFLLQKLKFILSVVNFLAHNFSRTWVVVCCHVYSNYFVACNVCSASYTLIWLAYSIHNPQQQGLWFLDCVRAIKHAKLPMLSMLHAIRMQLYIQYTIYIYICIYSNLAQECQIGNDINVARNYHSRNPTLNHRLLVFLGIFL